MTTVEIPDHLQNKKKESPSQMKMMKMMEIMEIFRDFHGPMGPMGPMVHPGFSDMSGRPRLQLRRFRLALATSGESTSPVSA